jgi:hypothetical protein
MDCIYDRITQINQYGEAIYIGQYKNTKPSYKDWGDFAEDMTDDAANEVLERLAFFEDQFETMLEYAGSYYRDSHLTK